MRQRLGKTLTAYAEFCMLREDRKVEWMIVICPNSLKGQWEAAIQEVDPIEPICVYNSARKDDEKYYFRKNKTGGILIINYESVRPYIESARPPVDLNKVYLVADESTKIKEWSNKSAKACIKLADMCGYKRILTGRPTANSNMDVWSQLRFIGATTRNYHQHKYTFCLLGGYMGRQVVSNQNTDMLKKEMEPYVYVAPDQYVKGFNRVYEPMRKIELTAELAKNYKSMEDDLLVSLSEGVNITGPLAITKYLRLAQLGSGIGGLEDGKQINLIDPHKNPRIHAVMDLLESECTNKTIIVCRFLLSITNLFQVLSDKGYKVVVIVGGEKPEVIEANKKEFNDGDADVLIGQIQTLSYGHTLPGNSNRPADSVIFFENSYSLIDRAQVEARPEKLGSDIPVSYYDFYSTKLDKHVLSSLIRKDDASLALLGYAREFGGRTKESVATDMEIANADGRTA